jgi:hypothetical protein
MKVFLYDGVFNKYDSRAVKINNLIITLIIIIIQLTTKILSLQP